MVFRSVHAQAYQERQRSALNPVCTDRYFDDDKPRERKAKEVVGSVKRPMSS